MLKRIGLFVLLACAAASAASKMKALIIDGQNNHAWKETTPVLKKLLEETGRFEVEVSTTPPKGGDMSVFKPDFKPYKLVVSNYNGEPWPAETQAAFEKFVREGGGFVSYHAADNAFPKWPEYNEMIAVGGWGNQQGPMIRFRDGKVVLDPTPGRAGNHGKRLPFQVIFREPGHPVAAGLPKEWLHAADECYDSLRGPAKNFQLIATAYSDRANNGTGENEPMLLGIRYGKGRVFHTTLGHDVAAMECVGFIVTLQRGAEWAATGRVTQKAPGDFPKGAVSVRKLR
jgi:type 1 glutamine amidotransferase